MTTSTLESLPFEISTRIYKHLFTDLEFRVHDPNFECSHKESSRPLLQGPLSILLTSKTIKQDAEPIFYDLAILDVCPCFLCRTETEDFEAMLSPLAKQRLQPLLRLWQLRRTVQDFSTRFRLYSGLQQIEFSYNDYGFSHEPRDFIGPIDFFIPHARKRDLNIWVKGLQNVGDQEHIVYFGINSTDTITIVAESYPLGIRAQRCLLGLAHFRLLGEEWISDKQKIELDESNTKFNIILDDFDEGDWVYRYRYQCLNGRKAAVKKFGRHA